MTPWQKHRSRRLELRKGGDAQGLAALPCRSGGPPESPGGLDQSRGSGALLFSSADRSKRNARKQGPKQTAASTLGRASPACDSLKLAHRTSREPCRIDPGPGATPVQSSLRRRLDGSGVALGVSDWAKPTPEKSRRSRETCLEAGLHPATLSCVAGRVQSSESRSRGRADKANDSSTPLPSFPRLPVAPCYRRAWRRNPAPSFELGFCADHDNPVPNYFNPLWISAVSGERTDRQAMTCLYVLHPPIVSFPICARNIM